MSKTPEKIRVNGNVYRKVDASKASKLFNKYTDYILEHARKYVEGEDPPPVEVEERLWKKLADEIGEREADGWFEEWARGLSDPDDKYAIDHYPFPGAPAPKSAKVRRTAQLQPLLQQYESLNEPLLKAVGNLNPEGLKKLLTGAHQSILGKQAEPAVKTLMQVKGGLDAMSKKIGELIEVTNTIAGHLGMGGE